jgi:Mn-dependent DtxR family transcriptional regulator
MCRERALRDGFQTLPEFEFSDSAVSGTKRDRHGLNLLLAAARSRQFHVLYFHSLSRLARESVISMPLLKELVYVHRIRVISVTEGVDSEVDGWDVLATLFSIQHERYLKELAANVFRGQEGAIFARFSVGDFRFGYTSIPSPNGEVVGRGREKKSRMVYAIHETQAEWVRKIFHWYVIDQQSIAWIVRELNRLHVDTDHRSTRKEWRRPAVIRLLRSEKYIGIWTWGRRKNERNPLTGKVTQEERDDEEFEQYTRDFPELRIIDDATFDAAQKRLDENNESYGNYRNTNGRLRGAPKGRCRNHLLAGLMQCRKCNSKLYVGGAHGKYLFCPGARDGICSCRTQLPRDLARQMILDVIGEKILENPEWCSAVHELTLQSWQQAISAQPDEAVDLKKQIEARNQAVRRIVAVVEQTDQPDPEFSKRLAELRTELRALERQLHNLESKPAVSQAPPTPEWIRQQLAHLGETLSSETPAAANALRNLLDGPIVLEEIPVDDRKRCYWRGTLVIRLGRVVQSAVSPGSDLTTEVDREIEMTETITLDFQRRTKTQIQGEEVWALYNQGELRGREIAKRLGVSRSRITAILQQFAKEQGQTLVDGRKRRWQLTHKSDDQLRHARLVGEIKRLWDDNIELGQIAERLAVCRDTVTKAIAEWHTIRGLPVPDGRTRRRTLPHKGNASRTEQDSADD